jgi:hypothetical protein
VPDVKNGVAGAPTVGGSMVPFFYGSNWYVEKSSSSVQTLDAQTHEVVANINPGGFMRGVRLEMRSTGGALGGGTLVTADNPAAILTSIGLENTDGAPIVYPMNGYAHITKQQYGRPWWGDPTRRYDYSQTVNPSLSWFIQPEIRHTAGVLSNTDARSQYRIRYTYNTLASLVTAGAPTAPAVTVTVYLESWAQPDDKDLIGNQIEQLPPGLNLQTLSRHQFIGLQAAGTANTFQIANMGNEIRLFLWIMRDSTGARVDLASDPIRWRLDNRSLGTFSPNELFNQMSDQYEMLQNGSTRAAGVYAWPRWFDVGRMVGQPWMATNNATYNIWETTTAAGGTNGSVEVITDEVVPGGDVPLELESI